MNDFDDKVKSFNNFIEAYKNLSITEKRLEFIRSLKELIAVFDALAEKDNISLDYVNSSEILDTNEEDDFLEASMVYLEVAKDIIGQYLSHFIEE